MRFELMDLSARSYHRILKVSRTIADMEGEEEIHSRHVAEALTYRAFDKKLQMMPEEVFIKKELLEVF